MSPSAAAGIRRWVVRGTCVASAFALVPAAAVGQVLDRDAHLPRSGQLWIEAAPTFHNWSDQYALNSAEVAYGSREPLTAHYGGPITARLFPGLDPLLELVNADAGALGFDPLTVSDVSMGSLDYGTINIDRREIPFRITFGILDRLALEVGAPLVRAHVEAPFSFDSAAANLVRADAAVTQTFLDELASAQVQLQALIDAGTLTPEDQATAEALLQESGDFSTALAARVDEGSYLFTEGSTPGQQMTATYGAFATGYGSFGITVPGFGLPASANSEDLNAYFQRSPVLGQTPADATRGWSIGEIDVGLRIGLLDTFGRPQRPPAPVPPETAPAEVEGEERAVPAAAQDTADTGEADEVGAQEALPPAERVGLDPVAQQMAAEEALAAYESGFRLRTTVGVRYRFPVSDPDRDPFLVPDVFLQEPIGDGQADLELELFQDVGLGSHVLFVAGARYGIQLADELTRRVAAPDQPFAYGEQEAKVRRDLGDFFELRISPRLLLNDVLSVAAEYTYWSKKVDQYSVVEGTVSSADPLAGETSEKRHRLGIGLYYRTTTRYALGLNRLPVELAFIYQSSIGGRGGRTPASEVVTGSLRFPLQLF